MRKLAIASQWTKIHSFYLNKNGKIDYSKRFLQICVLLEQNPDNLTDMLRSQHRKRYS